MGYSEGRGVEMKIQKKEKKKEDIRIERSGQESPRRLRIRG